MASRTLVSYDDISPAADGGSVSAGSAAPPPRKRRRNNHHQNNRRGGGVQQYPQHWDDPGSSAEPMSYGSTSGVMNANGVASAVVNAQEAAATVAMNVEGEMEEGEEEEEEEGEESRTLTHEEIWDDSALVDAWESATAEYEAFHGKDKPWKNAPVKKSPLWYNVPPKPKKATATTTTNTSTSTSATAQPTTNGTSPTTPKVPPAPDAENSQPVNFDTFVPVHDPSLSIPPAPTDLPGPPTNGPWPTRDEAFSRALGAMYWAGYWTAVYHSRQRSGDGAQEGEGAEEEGEEGEYVDAEAEDAEERVAKDGAGEEEELISTQR